MHELLGWLAKCSSFTCLLVTRVSAFLLFPVQYVYLICAVLCVRAVFYHENFTFNGSTWGSHYLHAALQEFGLRGAL